MSTSQVAANGPRAGAVSRRRFLQGSALAVGGLVVPFSIPLQAFAQGAGTDATGAAAPEINAWVVV